MNLYALHPDPESAPGYGARHDTVPELVWARYGGFPEELKKRETVLAREARYAFMYALHVLRGPFPAGEPAIAKDAGYAYSYAKDILKRRFPAGEPAIATQAYWSHWYVFHLGHYPVLR